MLQQELLVDHLLVGRTVQGSVQLMVNFGDGRDVSSVPFWIILPSLILTLLKQNVVFLTRHLERHYQVFLTHLKELSFCLYSSRFSIMWLPHLVIHLYGYHFKHRHKDHFKHLHEQSEVLPVLLPIWSTWYLLLESSKAILVVCFSLFNPVT